MIKQRESSKKYWGISCFLLVVCVAFVSMLVVRYLIQPAFVLNYRAVSSERILTPRNSFAGLENTTWQVVTVNGQTWNVSNKSAPILSIKPHGVFSGDGCNGISGQNAIPRTAGFAMTAIACMFEDEQGIQQNYYDLYPIADDYFDALNRTTFIRVDNDQLVLLDSTGGELIVLRRLWEDAVDY